MQRYRVSWTVDGAEPGKPIARGETIQRVETDAELQAKVDDVIMPGLRKSYPDAAIHVSWATEEEPPKRSAAAEAGCTSCG